MTDSKQEGDGAPIHVRRPGDKVSLLGDVPANVTQVCINGEGLSVTYECAWMHGGKRETAWFTPRELSGGRPEDLLIGFTGPPRREKCDGET